MAPTFNKIYEEVGIPYMNGNMETPLALEKASKSIKGFMIINTRESDISMFAEIAGEKEFETKEDSDSKKLFGKNGNYRESK